MVTAAVPAAPVQVGCFEGTSSMQEAGPSSCAAAVSCSVFQVEG